MYGLEYIEKYTKYCISKINVTLLTRGQPIISQANMVANIQNFASYLYLHFILPLITRKKFI